VHQMAIVQFKGRKMPLTGVLLLDGAGRSARLVTMNEMGGKLFDITVTKTGRKEHFVFPFMAEQTRILDALALSVRRIFLQGPLATDHAHSDGKLIQLVHQAEGETVLFTFCAEERTLRRKSGKGGWIVEYQNHRPVGGVLFPHRITYEDGRSGYGLTLAVLKVRYEQDQQTHP
jgi:hypothetical protein